MDLFFFLVLDLGNDYTDAIPVGYRILDGFFQVPPLAKKLIIGHFNENCWSISGQFGIVESGHFGELFGDDVYQCISCCYKYSTHKCL